MFGIALTHPHARLPHRATAGSAGLDVSAVEDVIIPPHSWKAVSTGLIVQVPNECYIRIAPRSGLAFRHGIDVLAGVVDSDYIDEVKVILYNHGQDEFVVRPGDRIAQFIFERIYVSNFCLVEPSDIRRGDRTGGFGSTGARIMQ
jgi:dUTP pyrophosphatase